MLYHMLLDLVNSQEFLILHTLLNRFDMIGQLSSLYSRLDPKTQFFRGYLANLLSFLYKKSLVLG